MENDFEELRQKQSLGEAVIKRVYDNLWKFSVCNLLSMDIDNESFEDLTTEEIVSKIRDFINQNPKDVNRQIFLIYLAKFPRSICKRDVSPLLKILIGFHYRFGVPNEQQLQNGASKVTYDDLSEIFVRSKATISECVNSTENQWKEFQRQLAEEQQIEEEAKRQLLEQKKAELRVLEQNNQNCKENVSKQPNEPE